METKHKILIAGAVTLPAVVLVAKSIMGSDGAESERHEVSVLKDVPDEAETARRKVMSEMGRKGGQKSKRGKAKPKEEKEEDGVSS